MRKVCELLYVLNFALLCTHEVDSAYWQEWNLFGISGGIQFFLFVNFVLFIAVIAGYSQLLKQKLSGYWFALLLAVSGVFTFSIHIDFILSGHPEFTLLGSELLLGIILIVSLLQAVLTVRVLIEKSHEF